MSRVLKSKKTHGRAREYWGPPDRRTLPLFSAAAHASFAADAAPVAPRSPRPRAAWWRRILAKLT